MKKCIDILTYCTQYPYEIYERFIGSLNDTGFSGKIWIIIRTHEDKNHLDKLSEKYSNIRPIIDKSIPTIHINAHRFNVYKELMEKAFFDSEYLLICDSRDVLFQKNFEEYEYDPNVDIYGFLEFKTINNETKFNKPWIQQIEYLVKEDILKQIGHNQIICCGTTMGKFEALKLYVNYMCDMFNKYRIKHNLDQGIHNYILYMNKLNVNVKLLSNKDNLVNTTNFDLVTETSHDGVKRINDDNLIVNENNEVSYIVHQYDRFPIESKKKLSHKYNFVL